MTRSSGSALYSQHLVRRFRHRIVGQDLAVREVVRSLTLARARVHVRSGPLATYLFLGPTGVGKSALAGVVAEELYGREDLVVPVHLASVQNGVGFIETLGFHVERFGGIHLEPDAHGRQIRYCQAVIVIADVHEASDEVISLICHTLDHGRIQLGGGDIFDFSRAMFVFECGIVGEHLDELTRTSPIGFHGTGPDDDENDEVDEKIYQLARRTIESAFSMEFVGRLDRVIVFRRLRPDHLPALMERSIARVVDAFRARGYDGLELTIEPELEEHLLEKAERRLHLGARPLMRNIRKYVVFPLADLVVSGALAPGVHVVLGIDEGDPIARFEEAPALPSSTGVRLIPPPPRGAFGG
jgi:ATP-dependent Clp protease ATP-binding subunit ClpA